MVNVTTLSWRDIEHCCIKIKDCIQDLKLNIEAIVCIQRGGCIPGVILSHLLNVEECYVINIRTTSSEEIRAKRLDTPVLYIPDALKGISEKTVLLIDDVTNTGNTLKYAKDEISKFNPSICLTAVLVWDGDNNNECKADIYAKYTPGWVIFPWETIEQEL